MTEHGWLADWLVAFGAGWFALPRDRGRMLFLSVVMVAGKILNAAGPNGRDHWLHSSLGDTRALWPLLFVVVCLAVFACRRTLPDTHPRAAWKRPEVWLYAALALVGTGFGYPQALALGIYIDGIVSWGMSDIWHASSVNALSMYR